ncbi:HEAT repeat domain-containing protein [Streptomyces californicus]|uniref:HEAT repeat domain-containing protein n=2 Tax=Streptomyces californicus TaxID=67351 RepID=UPI0033FE12F9
MIKGHEGGLLAGLDDIDWAKLHHAYGSAHDFPGQLRLVCCDDEDLRKSAWLHLFNTIFHQGSRYTSSAAAVPFFARIARSGPEHARPTALHMLTRLAVDWHDAYTLPAGIDTATWRALAAENTPEKMAAWYEGRLAAENDPERRSILKEARDFCLEGGTPDIHASTLPCYDAVRTELRNLYPLMEDPDPEIRVRTAYLLAWFPEEGARIIPHLMACLDREQHTQARATALVAAGLVGDHSLLPRLRPYLSVPEPLVRWAAATALARLLTTGSSPDAGGEELVARVIEELTHAATTPPSAPDVPEAVYNGGDLRGYAARALAPLAVHASHPVLPVIMDALSADTAVAAEAVIAALAGAFPGEAPPETVPFAALNAGTQHILRCVARRGPWDQYETPVENCLSNLRLPDNPAALSEYVHPADSTPSPHATPCLS